MTVEHLPVRPLSVSSCKSICPSRRPRTPPRTTRTRTPATRAAGRSSACWSSACSSSCSTTRCSTSRCGRSPTRSTASAPARASSSGRSTRTPWSSPVCSSPGACSATASAAAGCCIAGMIMFGLASLASAYAQTPEQLIGARALMGIGGAAVLPATLSIISNVFDPRERGKAIGIWAGAVGLGVAIGPVVGGALLEHFWWGSVFLINVPIVVVGVIAILAARAGVARPEAGPARLRRRGAVHRRSGRSRLRHHRRRRPRLRRRRARGARSSAASRCWPRSSGGSGGSRSRRWTCGCSATRGSRRRSARSALVFFAAMGTLFFMAFYLQLVRGYSPLRVGLLLTPFAVAQLIFAPRSASDGAPLRPEGGLRGRSRPGRGSRSPGSPRSARTTPIWVLGVLFFIQGVGMANVMPPATESIMASLPREKAGVGSAIGNTVRQVAGALGIAILGSVLSAVYRSQIDDHLGALPAGAAGRRRRVDLGDVRRRRAASPAHRPRPRLAGRRGNERVRRRRCTGRRVGSAIVAVLGVVVVLAGCRRRPRAGIRADRRCRQPSRTARDGSSWPNTAGSATTAENR